MDFSTGIPAAEPDLVRDTLHQLAAPFRASGGAVLLRDNRSGSVRMLCGLGVSASSMMRLASYAEPGFWSATRVYAWPLDGQADGDALAGRKGCRAGLAESGFVHVLAGTIPAGPAAIAILFFRGKEADPFGPRSENLLRLLLPFLGSVFQIQWQNSQRDEVSSALQNALDRLSLGIAVSDSAGHSLYMNDSARTLLRRTGAAGADATNVRTLMDDMRRHGGGLNPGKRAVVRLLTAQDDAEPLTCILVPLAPEGEEGFGQPSALFLSSVSEFSQYTEHLIRLYGLTRLEAMVVSLILEGRSAAEAAVEMRVSIHTVRAYLKRVFAKTGVHRQSALMRLLTGLAQVRPDAMPLARTPAPRLAPINAQLRRSPPVSAAIDVVM